jgi:hypothetical protein
VVRRDCRPGGLVCFEVEGLEPDSVVKKLKGMQTVASSTPYRLSFARFTPRLTNFPDEIAQAVAAVRSLA